ncbi:unnamed protein product, partial [marine sediment metagenome]
VYCGIGRAQAILSNEANHANIVVWVVLLIDLPQPSQGILKATQRLGELACDGLGVSFRGFWKSAREEKVALEHLPYLIKKIREVVAFLESIIEQLEAKAAKYH